MKSYGQFCPMARASEIVAERWTPIILRNMLAGCQTFGEILDGAPGLSKTLLTQRLRGLERRRIVERRTASSGRGHTYHLTEVGRELWSVLEALGTWGARYLDLDPDHLNPYVVLWDVSRLIEERELPHSRVVVRFDLTDRDRRNRFWLVLNETGVDLCDKAPGYDEDLLFTTDSETLAHWHLGWVPLRRAMREGRITIAGTPRLVREFVRRWQGLSLLAQVTPERSIPAR
ncbi:MAG TPA: helix-turn-helix domain-containing protein [Actinomycetota bacterium]|nr:helix-turn-helix domain-containing protein [Actinomycetota bacterium]